MKIENDKGDSAEPIVETCLDFVRDYFEDNGSPIKCHKCDSIKIEEKITGVVDVFQGMGPTCEAEYFCECGECVGYWAYGSWHPQYRESFLANAELGRTDEGGSAQ